jgi:capsid assembly protease
MTLRRGEGVSKELRQFRSLDESTQHVLAMDPKALGLWFSGGFDETCIDEGLAIVSITGPLEHHGMGWWFDSYDAIVARIELAFKDDEARAVVMCFDSPGGDASGVEEAHRKIRALQKQYDKPLVAYSNEGCYSAAYWLACAASDIWVPATGGVGSVGVIAAAVDCTEANKKHGVRIELVTTGKRKADGHPDRPLTDEILGVMQARVDQIGDVFFASVAKSREMKPDEVKALQAGVFLGDEAVEAGLADGVAGWDEFLDLVRQEYLGVDAPTDQPVGMGGKAPEAKASSARRTVSMKAKSVLSLTKSRDAARATLEAAKTPEERKAALSAFEAASEELAKMKYSKRTRTDEVEEDDGEDDDDKNKDSEDEESDEDDDDDDEPGKKDDDEDAEDEESEEEDAEEEEEKALASLTGKSARPQVSRLYKAAATLTGQRTVGAILGALEGIGPRLKNAEKNEARIEKLEKAQVRKDVIAMLDKAGTKVTPAMRASLLKQGLKDPEWLKGHLASLPKQARSFEDGASKPKTNADGSASVPDLDLGAMTKEEREMYEAGARAAGTTIEKFMASAKEVATKIAAGAPRH